MELLRNGRANSATARANLLAARGRISQDLKDNPYSTTLFYQRMRIYQKLGYHDLAAMDAYKMLLLVDEVMDDSGEYHDLAIAVLSRSVDDHLCDRPPHAQSNCPEDSDLLHKLEGLVIRSDSTPASEEETQRWCESLLVPLAPLCLAENLFQIDCIRPAWTYVQQALKASQQGSEIHSLALSLSERVLGKARTLLGLDGDPHESVGIERMPHAGRVRREVYPWNDHEAERTSYAAVAYLNDLLIQIAPKLKVEVTELPALTAGIEAAKTQTVKQLGVFAKQDIDPGEELLRERSLLTANNKLHEPMCDACGSVLPDLAASQQQDRPQNQTVECPGCMDTVFCSQKCLDLAQESYHAAICGADIDAISRDVPAKDTADALYTLLLLRALAMAQCQDKHPLDLDEVKYIWGDFNDAPSEENSVDTGKEIRTLPFTFEANILTPLHLLESLDMNIFEAPSDIAEVWVYNTLYAKFRGTASARLNPRDGRPEVAAVHPLWCLANHSCDPNVEWEWAGEICFFARKERTGWQTTASIIDESANGLRIDHEMRQRHSTPFIKKGDEILNHYVDVDLPVNERREWGMGALGGPCMCPRCQAETEMQQDRTKA